jgi:hypothetical protein
LSGGSTQSSSFCWVLARFGGGGAVAADVSLADFRFGLVFLLDFRVKRSEGIAFEAISSHSPQAPGEVSVRETRTAGRKLNRRTIAGWERGQGESVAIIRKERRGCAEAWWELEKLRDGRVGGDCRSD